MDFKNFTADIEALRLQDAQQSNEALKIDFELLIQDYQVVDVDIFCLYLKEIWADLASKSKDSSQGVCKSIFNQVSLNVFNLFSIIFFQVSYLKGCFPFLIRQAEKIILT